MLIKGPTPPVNALNRVVDQNAKTSGELSSGKRINQAGDDAAGLSLARKLEAQEVSLSQAGRNLADATSFLRVADGGLDSTHSVLGRLRELAVQAVNSTLSDDQRQNIQAEASALSEELGRIEQTTQFNGQAVFADGLSLEIQASDDAGETISIDPGGRLVSPLGLDTIDLSSPDSALGFLDTLDSAADQVSARRASLGASANRLGIAEREVGSTIEGLAGARSRIEDADVAETTARSVAERIRAQAGIGVQAHAGFNQSLLGTLYEGLG